MENLTAVLQNRSYTGHIKGNNVLLRDFGAFELDDKMSTFISFLDNIDHVVIPLQVVANG